ncbi:MAG: prohibitin family protein [Myxococcales bacterium]|nr:prohibitin family protein [Polyangiaceae bacterium]MDW8247874.1 prohibitin family protein [Myxococcales bacterium]
MAPQAKSDGIRFFQKLALLLIVLIAMIFVGCASIDRIDAGHVGIRVSLAGSARGIQDIPVVSGWVFYNPLTEQIIEFPTNVQNITWTRSATEGSPTDDSITFSSSEGVNINADIGLSFHIDPPKAPHLYMRFRENNLLRLANGYVRNAVREAFNDVASKMPVQEIYGSGKGKLISEVTRKLQEKLGPDGFLLDQVTINGALRLPENVAQAINRAMEATQNSIQAENRVRQVRAEAEQAIAKAQGEAEAARTRARGEADALLIRAKAEARANQIIRLSTTGAVLQYRALERWNGKLPLMNSGQTPMLTFDLSKIIDEKDADTRLKKLLDEPEEPVPASSTLPSLPHLPAPPPLPNP